MNQIYTMYAKNNIVKKTYYFIYEGVWQEGQRLALKIICHQAEHEFVGGGGCGGVSQCSTHPP